MGREKQEGRERGKEGKREGGREVDWETGGIRHILRHRNEVKISTMTI